VRHGDLDDHGLYVESPELRVPLRGEVGVVAVKERGNPINYWDVPAETDNREDESQVYELDPRNAVDRVDCAVSVGGRSCELRAELNADFEKDVEHTDYERDENN